MRVSYEIRHFATAFIGESLYGHKKRHPLDAVDM